MKKYLMIGLLIVGNCMGMDDTLKDIQCQLYAIQQNGKQCEHNLHSMRSKITELELDLLEQELKLHQLDLKLQQQEPIHFCNLF